MPRLGRWTPSTAVPEIDSVLSPSLSCFWLGEKPGSEPEEVKLQKASKQIVQNAILQAVQQVSQESRQNGERARDSRGSLQLGVGELTKKHEKK
ncbi:hypothetical protein GH733_001882 [Mirounga leonina]|nr:hypothetical protein GH733_001882 [Mirounga leonina]